MMQHDSTDQPMNLYLRIYLARQSGRVMPRWLRRLAARSALHRDWLSGFTGCFEQDGVRYGPANPYSQPCPAGLLTASERANSPPLSLISAAAAIPLAG